MQWKRFTTILQNCTSERFGLVHLTKDYATLQQICINGWQKLIIKRRCLNLYFPKILQLNWPYTKCGQGYHLPQLTVTSLHRMYAPHSWIISLEAIPLLTTLKLGYSCMNNIVRIGGIKFYIYLPGPLAWMGFSGELHSRHWWALQAFVHNIQR